MNQEIYDCFESNPIIAAIKDINGLKQCCMTEEIKIVFVLFGDICSIGNIVEKLKKSGKQAMIHVDLIGGFGSKEIIVDFVKQNTLADGIITTKQSLIKRAGQLGLTTVLRYFLIDSMALENIRIQQNVVHPDFIEVLPGVMPKIIKEVCRLTKIPIIAGGLISDKESVMGALSAGAVAVSTSTAKVWRM